MRALTSGSFAVSAAALLASGCVPVFPDNTKPGDPPQREILRQEGRLTYSAEPGVTDGQWVALERADASGAVGGYLSDNEPHRPAIVILLHGASTLMPDASVGSARMFHEATGPIFRERGYRTLALTRRECGTAYGQGDLEDVLEVVDWLDAEGKAQLGVERVYMLGYSAGGTLVSLTNRERTLDALVSISGFTQPDQLEEGWNFYALLALLYPDNAGLCQLGTTLETYGRPGSATWQFLDSVAHLDEFHCPMLVVHGNDDPIVFVANALHLQQRYLELLGVGTTLPRLEFMYVSGGHDAPMSSPQVRDRVLSFFDEFEPPWSPP